MKKCVQGQGLRFGFESGLGLRSGLGFGTRLGLELGQGPGVRVRIWVGNEG